MCGCFVHQQGTVQMGQGTLPFPSGLTPMKHTFLHPKEWPRWQQGGQPAQPFDMTTHQPGSHYSQPEKPQVRALTPHAGSSPAPGTWAPPPLHSVWR